MDSQKELDQKTPISRITRPLKMLYVYNTLYFIEISRVSGGWYLAHIQDHTYGKIIIGSFILALPNNAAVFFRGYNSFCCFPLLLFRFLSIIFSIALCIAIISLQFSQFRPISPNHKIFQTQINKAQFQLNLGFKNTDLD